MAKSSGKLQSITKTWIQGIATHINEDLWLVTWPKKSNFDHEIKVIQGRLSWARSVLERLLRILEFQGWIMGRHGICTVNRQTNFGDRLNQKVQLDVGSLKLRGCWIHRLDIERLRLQYQGRNLEEEWSFKNKIATWHKLIRLEWNHGGSYGSNTNWRSIELMSTRCSNPKREIAYSWEDTYVGNCYEVGVNK